MPTLADRPFVRWKSAPIRQYPADKADGDALFARDPQKRADVVRWQCWEGAHFRVFATLTVPLTMPSADFSAAVTGLATRFRLPGHVGDLPT